MGFLSWAIVCLVASAIAGALGFTGVAREAAPLSRLFFFLFLATAVLLLTLILLGFEVAETASRALIFQLLQAG